MKIPLKVFSTNKKRTTITATMSKPTQFQLNIAKKTLAKMMQVCVDCFKETVEWIQCHSCLLWMYFTCTILKINSIPDNYIC